MHPSKVALILSMPFNYWVFFAAPVNISSLVTLTVVVVGSKATVSARLSSGFQGSTGFTVTYGITPNCDANTVMSANNGMAGDTLEVILTSLQPNFAYCYSIYFNQSFKVMGMFHSGGSCKSMKTLILYHMHTCRMCYSWSVKSQCVTNLRGVFIGWFCWWYHDP